MIELKLCRFFYNKIPCNFGYCSLTTASMKTRKSFRERKVVELLQQLTKDEQRQLTAWLQFRGSKIVVKLYGLIRHDYPDYDLSEERLFRKLYPKKMYDDGLFRRYVSELNQLVREYFAFVQYRADYSGQQHYLLTALTRRGIHKAFGQILERGRKQLTTTTVQDIPFFYEQHRFYDIAYQYTTIYNHRAKEDALQSATDSFDIYYVAQKLKYLTAMRMRERIIEANYRYRLEEELLAYLEAKPFGEVAIIELYRFVLLILGDMENDARFVQFKTALQQYWDRLSEEERRQLYTCGINCAHWKIERGQLSYTKERFDFYRIMLDSGMLYVEGHIHPHHFKNIVTFAIEAAETDWAAQFIEEQITRVRADYRNNIHIYTKALLHFTRGAYKEQANYMRQMEQEGFHFIDPYYNLAYRVLAIKTAYEQLYRKANIRPIEIEALKAYLERLRNYINRKEGQQILPQRTCQAHEQFRKLVGKLLNRQAGRRVVERDIVQEILNTKPLIEIPWLLKLGKQANEKSPKDN